MVMIASLCVEARATSEDNETPKLPLSITMRLAKVFPHVSLVLRSLYNILAKVDTRDVDTVNR